MMLRKYRARVASIDKVTARNVAEMLQCRRIRRGEHALFRTLDSEGFDQADLVLCLLRLNTRTALRHAERLVGHKIMHCPTAYKWRPIPGATRDYPGDDRRVMRVQSRPKLESGRRAWLRRYPLFQVGLTVAQLLRRGVRPGDLKMVTQRGWVELSA
jgi:hypothetical protein